MWTLIKCLAKLFSIWSHNCTPCEWFSAEIIFNKVFFKGRNCYKISKAIGVLNRRNVWNYFGVFRLTEFGEVNVDVKTQFNCGTSEKGFKHTRTKPKTYSMAFVGASQRTVFIKETPYKWVLMSQIVCANSLDISQDNYGSGMDESQITGNKYSAHVRNTNLRYLKKSTWPLEKELHSVTS